MSYPYSLTPGHVTLSENWSKTGSHSLTERRLTEAVRQKELLDNQRVYSLLLDKNRQAGYDRLLFGPNNQSSLYPKSSRKYATNDEERSSTLQQYRR